MSLKGIDISNWQAGINLSAIAGQVDFIIVKATEGVGFVDKQCDKFFQEAKLLGKKLGFYHFARTNNAIAEADFFYNNTKNYFGQAIPILDWEVDDSVDWVNKFVNRIHELSGVWPWVYANPWRFNQGVVNTNCGRWVAGYPYAITDINYGLNYPLPSSYRVNGVICAWQFTSSCRLHGYNGSLDANVFYGDEEAWMAYAGGGSGARLGFADAAAEVMEHLCTHSAHGYSQPNRAGVGTGGAVSETITLSDGTRVGISGGDRDCSSACIECYAALGVDVGGATYTGNMRRCMTGTGNFRWHPWGTYTAKRGDIYLNETHHTAMCLGDGKLGEFSRSELHSTHGTKGDQDGWESHITSFYTYSKGWDGVLEYVGPEPEPAPEPDGYDKTKLPASLQRFDDVDPDAWYVDSLDWAVSNDIMSGYSTDTFDPNGTLNRAQATCILANYSGVKTEHTFSDVTPGNYYYDAVEWAAGNDITSGLPDGSFNPDGACTREQLCCMLYNMAGDADGVIWPVTMDDWSSVSTWARDAVAWAVEEGIIGNTGAIRPGDACTRAEAAAMLHNYSKR